MNARNLSFFAESTCTRTIQCVGGQVVSTVRLVIDPSDIHKALSSASALSFVSRHGADRALIAFARRFCAQMKKSL